MTSTDKNLSLAPWETIQHSSWDVSFVSSGYETPLWVLGITLTSYLSSPGLFLHPQNKFHSVISSPLWKPSFIRAYFPCDRKTDPFCPIQSTVPPPFLRPCLISKANNSTTDRAPMCVLQGWKGAVKHILPEPNPCEDSVMSADPEPPKSLL